MAFHLQATCFVLYSPSPFDRCKATRNRRRHNMIAPRARELFSPERLLAFSDGVFAVAITLLVIDMRLQPGAADRSDPALLQALLGMEPKLLVFVFTFLVVGMHWLGHAATEVRKAIHGG